MVTRTADMLREYGERNAQYEFCEAAAEIDRLRRLLFIVAPSFQGGNSRDGGMIAEELGVPFPITVPALEKQARADGLDPDELWPWRTKFRAAAPSA